jgi:hypothetical protein
VLVCEVFDDAAAMPKLRNADDSDESGRGLHVVSQLAQRWGTRRTPDGKAVWFELALPEDWPAPRADARRGAPPAR